ncbi:MAG: PD40 domain-containing protein, partial [Chloroflexi bacterium]|nr:PD40 domain-containing protein [Chloroflexota bacterium]
MTSPMQHPVTPQDLLNIKTVTDVQLSPDGRRAAYVLTEIDTAKDEYRSAIWVAHTQGGATQFTAGTKQDSAPRWSPDGRWLAFLSNRAGDRAQLYVMPADGGEARVLTSLDNGAGPAVWSPDSQHILFAARVMQEPPPADPAARARWTQRPRRVTRAQYKADGQGFTFDGWSHLFVVPLAGGNARQLTSGAMDNGAPGWSPDGQQIAFSRPRAGITDYSLSDIWTMNADGGGVTPITEVVGRATSPSWSPDGASIACYGTDEQEAGLGDPLIRVWIIPAAGGAPRRLTEHYDRGAVLLPPPATAFGPVWSADGASVLFISADSGNTQLVRAALADGRVEP